MPIDTVVSPQTPGAARRYSYVWPSLGLTTNLNVPTGQSVNGRPNGSRLDAYWAPATTGAPPAPRGMIFYKGRIAWQMTSNGTGNSGENAVPSFAGINRPLIMPFQETRGPVNISSVDDWSCWSFSAILAFDQVPGAIVGDLGIVVACGTRGLIRFGSTHAGMELGPTAVDTVGVICRQVDGGATTFAQNFASPIDITDFHLYEIRIIGPTDTAEARVKFLVDGQVGIELPYGPGTVLPSQLTVVPGNVGMTPNVINWRANAATCRMYIAPWGCTIKSAPDESSLL